MTPELPDSSTNTGETQPVETSPWDISPAAVPSSAPTPGPAANLGSAGVAESPASRFTIERLHAKGGLGQISLARDGQLSRPVALKEIRPERRGPENRRRFLNEAEITGQLEHPGIVPIYALEKDAAGEPYYVMRFIQGRSMSEAIRDYHTNKLASSSTRVSDNLALRDLLQRFVSVCQTMAFAHSMHVIHRDLKPANVMLGDFGETLIVDWGLAKRISNDKVTGWHGDKVT